MEEQNRKASGMNIGSASIIMVFSVLCLTIFAVLSFITANNEYKLSIKSSDAVKTYYAADTNAVVTEAKIREKLASASSFKDAEKLLVDLDVEVENAADGSRISYSETVDENQEIQVILFFDGETLKTEQWKLVNVAEWNADGDINLWDGE